MLYPFRASAYLNPAGEQFITAHNRSAALGCAAAAPPLAPRCEKLLNAEGGWATLPETRPTKSQPYALSGLHRDDERRRDKDDRKMGIQDRKYEE